MNGHDVSSFDDEKIISELKGNTLRVYWALMNAKDGVLGVRELQRRLGFSSPALASYHLNKLADMKLVVKERGDYKLVREVKVGVLKQFIKLGTFLLPRYVLYATMFTTLLFYLLVNLRESTFYSAFALVLGSLGTVIFWYETVRVWRQKP
ncbi:MAG TPA: winged helix-turn-helix domain-containing protein [Patescibacteria group bacterium]|nr:winged helix-turn-helix domain-containing protein [Patescibacteria group bacterium]